MEERHLEHERRIEAFRATSAAGETAIKLAFLLNGGAAIAWLAFMAEVTRIEAGKASYAVYGLSMFGTGTIAAAFAMASMFFSLLKSFPQKEQSGRLGDVFLYLSLIVTFSSYICFALGLGGVEGFFEAIKLQSQK